MKKLIIVLLSLWTVAQAQVPYQPISPKDSGVNFNKVNPKIVLHVPEIADLLQHTSSPDGQIRIVDGDLWYYSKITHLWKKVTGISSSTNLNTSYDWTVLDSLDAPTGSEIIGTTLLVSTAPTGLFGGHQNAIAVLDIDGVTWLFTDPSSGQTLMNVATDFTSQWNTTSWLRVGKAAIHHGLDEYGLALKIGTIDNQDLNFWTNNISRFTISNSGGFTFGSLSGTGDGLMGLNSGGTAFRTTIGTGLDLTAGVLSSTGSGLTGFDIDDLPPIFTSNVDITNPSSPFIHYDLTAAPAYSYLGNNTGTSAIPTYNVPTYGRLGDVALSSIADGQLTHWDAGLGKWVNFTPLYLTSNQSITWTGSGDVSGTASGTTSITPTLTLATVNPNVGTFGDATHIPQITYDAKGRATGVTTVAISAGGGENLQQTLDIGSTLNKDNTVVGAGFNWSHNGLGTLSFAGNTNGDSLIMADAGNTTWGTQPKLTWNKRYVTIDTLGYRWPTKHSNTLFSSVSGQTDGSFSDVRVLADTTGDGTLIWKLLPYYVSTSSFAQTYFGSAGTGGGRISNGTGSRTFFGYGVFPSQTNSNNVAGFGVNTGHSVTTASSIDAFGTNNLFNNTTGSQNSIFGTYAGNGITTQGNNALFGAGAMSTDVTNAARNTTGVVTSGSSALGVNAGSLLTANYSSTTTANNSIFIGHANGMVALGNTLDSTTIIGNFMRTALSNVFILGGATQKIIIPNNLLTVTDNTTAKFQTPSLSTGWVTKAANYTLGVYDHTVNFTTTATATLPTSTGTGGFEYYLINSASTTLTINTTSSQTFTNVTGTPTSLSIAGYGAVQLQSSGAGWNVTASVGAGITGSGGGGGGGTGTVNSGTINRLSYYASTGTAVSELAAITANRALISDANGLPIASTVTNTTLSFLDATSSVQTQLNAKQASLTTGTSAQYFRGDLSLATFPTAVSSFTNDAGYLTSYTETDPLSAHTANNLSDLANAGTARTNLGLAIGTNVQAYDADLSTWAGLTPSTLGQNIVTQTNPSAITFPRYNADNTVSALDAATFRTAIGAGTGTSSFSGAFADLTGIPTTVAGYGITDVYDKTASDARYFRIANNLSEGTAATMRINLGLGNVENTALSTWAGSSNITTVGSLLSHSMADGANIALGTTTGTKIGTATNQKLGFFNATPVIQQSGDIGALLQAYGLCAGAGFSYNAAALSGTVLSGNLPATLVYTGQTNTYTAGMKQIFQTSASTSGFRLVGVTADPSSPASGDVWFRSDDGFLRYHDGASVKTIVNTGGVQTFTNKTIDALTNTISNIAAANMTMPAYSLNANNTSSTAAPTSLTYENKGIQTYVGTDTWDGTAPTGAATKQYQWIQTGKEVKLWFWITYATAGATNTTIDLTLPSDLPLPAELGGRTGTNDILYSGVGKMGISTTQQSNTSRYCFIIKTGTGAYKITVAAASASSKTAEGYISYIAQ